MDTWDAHFYLRGPLFAPLVAYAQPLAGDNWPERERLQALADERGVISGGGKPLKLVPQPVRVESFEARYEVRLHLTGELPLREANWHDFFNFLVWLAFPRAKAALNARHYQAALRQRETGAANRGPTQDALTLFDEGGMIVASSGTSLLDDLSGLAWKRLFWQRREAVSAGMCWHVFGHALYEKALSPYLGVTGRGILIPVEASFHALMPTEQTACLDAQVATRIAAPERLAATGDLTPVPVLGVPGWWPANEDPAFYDNTAYFRPSRGSSRR